MLKTPEEKKLEDDSTKYFYMNKVIDNIKVKQQNGRLWTPYHDMQLYEYVIKYNFNFYEISNAFQRLCINEKKYEYSEDAVRLHWAFLHAMRHFEQTPDEAYYQRMKLQYDKEKPKTFKKRVEEKEKEKLSEEEEIKRMKKEFENLMKEKYDENKENKENKQMDDNKENTKVELDIKEKEEVDEIIYETKRKKEEEEKKEENIDNKEDKDKKEDKEKKEEKDKAENNKLFDESNEPEYIKQLFNKKIPQDILDKLNKDQGKYNNSPSKQSPSDNNPQTASNIINNEPKESPQIQSKENEIVTNEIKNNFIEKEEEDLFPIKSNKQKEISEPGKFLNINMEKELQNTQDFHDYIESNPELKKQYDQLNNYCNFAVKSINYLVNKSTGIGDTNSEEAKKIEQTNKQLNELLLQPIIQETKEKGYTLEDWNKKIEEEENKMNFETTNYDNYMKDAPIDDDRDMKLNKFKEHLFSFAEKISTEELLEKITGIINQNNSEENNNENNIQENNDDNININGQNNNNNNINNNLNNINLEHEVQNFMNNLENNNMNNNIEDEKSEITKEQSESVNENLTENNGRNTISSVGSLEFPKKYRHVYRGMVYYDDKPNKKENKNNNIKKKIQEDDEIEEDDDEDADEYNK